MFTDYWQILIRGGELPNESLVEGCHKVVRCLRRGDPETMFYSSDGAGGLGFHTAGQLADIFGLSPDMDLPEDAEEGETISPPEADRR